MANLSLTGFVIKALFNGLRKILLYELVHGNVRKLYAVNKFEVSTARLSVLLSEFSASTEILFHLQLPIVTRRSTVVVDAEGSAMEMMKALESKPIDISVFYKPRNRLGLSTIVIN